MRNFRLDEIPVLKNARDITTNKIADGIREHLHIMSSRHVHLCIDS
jgi:hypothetical protein